MTTTPMATVAAPTAARMPVLTRVSDRAVSEIGTTITAEVEVGKVRPDKPITELHPRVIRDDGTVVLDGDAVCYTMPIRK